MSTNLSYDESALISSFQRGERWALQQVYELYMRPLCYFTDQIVADTLAAEDIVSECFIQAFQRKEQFPSLPGLKSFLYTAAKNAALNFLKSQQRHQAVHQSIALGSEKLSIDVEKAYIKSEVLQIIYREIEKLPPQCSAVVRLSIIDGKRPQEIAEELDMAYQTVLNQKAKGLAILRTNLLKNKLVAWPILATALTFLNS
ncbi:hypothetical protein COR50_19840 [Chitinophaga caeni]|uniref:RNA polymerase subunit sigma-24 n=1 Tax=Chitinophaga caeni TaxID=2029983 RepID=A0A291QZH2_9BACT|nr:sigma-70 family RNA polymerase sigma factor [Chitinophaga caeni]ATL49243.1 hypothetical protein COR50_19840 [Chitinophaga caeni]